MKPYNLMLVGGGFILGTAIFISNDTYIIKTNFMHLVLNSGAAAIIVFVLFVVRLIKLHYLKEFHSITIASIDLVLMVCAILALVMSAWANSPEKDIGTDRVSNQLSDNVLPLITLFGFIGSQLLFLVNVVVAMVNKRRKS